ncbi:MAG: transcriptional regulator NrdR [Alphaproteobacteria bacterium]|nr:transcriptional regulator NrdR [Alphaproteobacteria bacterium]
MRCPFCSHEDSQVKDSRPTEDGAAIRRRRICPGCGGRFTTFERIQLREMTVIKHDGRKQVFDRDKIFKSMHTALRKRNVQDEQIEKAVTAIVRQLESLGESEIQSTLIGDMVMKALARLDTIAYIRFASVYKDFRKPEDFNEFLEDVRHELEGGPETEEGLVA